MHAQEPMHRGDVLGARAAEAPRPAERAREIDPPPPSVKVESAPKPEPRSQRKIAVAQPNTDPKVIERERLLARLVAAEGRPAITRAADAFVAAGFELPEEQGVLLQMLEHSREHYVQDAIEKLSQLLVAEPCKRQTVLESRLRRLEEFADEPSLRDSARELRRRVRTAAPVARTPVSEPPSDDASD